MLLVLLAHAIPKTQPLQQASEHLLCPDQAKCMLADSLKVFDIHLGGGLVLHVVLECIIFCRNQLSLLIALKDLLLKSLSTKFRVHLVDDQSDAFSTYF